MRMVIIVLLSIANLISLAAYIEIEKRLKLQAAAIEYAKERVDITSRHHIEDLMRSTSE